MLCAGIFPIRHVRGPYALETLSSNVDSELDLVIPTAAAIVPFATCTSGPSFNDHIHMNRPNLVFVVKASCWPDFG